MNKERIIEGITERIKSEFNKHSKVKELDWAKLAAIKLYNSYLIELKN
jgi:hypothetical protein